MTGSARWQLGAGADRWNGSRTFATASAGVRLVTPGDRVDARIQARTWFGGGGSFQSGQALVLARSSARPVGTVIVATGGISGVTASAPGDVWFAGDTGRARPLLLRAHPILAEGARFRTERLGRLVGNGSVELQRWWKVGPFRAGGATFADAARTARRVAGSGCLGRGCGCRISRRLAGQSRRPPLRLASEGPFAMARRPSRLSIAPVRKPLSELGQPPQPW